MCVYICVLGRGDEWKRAHGDKIEITKRVFTLRVSGAGCSPDQLRIICRMRDQGGVCVYPCSFPAVRSVQKVNGLKMQLACIIYNKNRNALNLAGSYICPTPCWFPISIPLSVGI